MTLDRTAGTRETASGEVEHERLSRRANAVEASLVYAAVLGAMWLGAAQPGALTRGSLPQAAGVILAVAAVAWVFAVAPRLHGDSWHSLGLARPWELAGVWRPAGAGFRAAVVLLVVAAPLLLGVTTWRSLLIRAGVRQASRDAFVRLTSSPWSEIGSLITAAAAGVLVAAVLVRWSNLARAARALAVPLAALVATAGALAVVMAAQAGDWRPFATASWTGTDRSAFLPGLAAYAPWALLQQWFVLAYFNTRVRRAVPPGRWGGVPAPLVVAALTGAAFGALHLPNLPLALLTCVGGAVSGWLFQHDRSRHLFLLAFGHAVAGTVLVALTTMGLSVGPRL